MNRMRSMAPLVEPACRHDGIFAAVITAQTHGIPIFAVETVRSLIDFDLAADRRGYRLVGDVHELIVPDSLHALLAACHDALDPSLRRLVSDAAVLGTTFPAVALIAVSGQNESTHGPPWASCCTGPRLPSPVDPLSPEEGQLRGSP